MTSSVGSAPLRTGDVVQDESGARFRITSVTPRFSEYHKRDQTTAVMGYTVGLVRV